MQQPGKQNPRVVRLMQSKEAREPGASRQNRQRTLCPQDTLWEFYYIECKMNCQSNKKNTLKKQTIMHNISNCLFLIVRHFKHCKENKRTRDCNLSTFQTECSSGSIQNTRKKQLQFCFFLFKNTCYLYKIHYSKHWKSYYPFY